MRPDPSSNPSSEELIVYGLLLLVGAIPVAIAIAQDARFGVEATLGLLMVCAGAIGAITHLTQARRALEIPATRYPTGASGAGSRSR